MKYFHFNGEINEKSLDDSEHLKPNEEMKLQSELLASIEKIENIIKKNETA